MITPCPQCGSVYLWITVTQKANQRISLDGPYDGTYTYTVQHENVQDTTYLRAQCRACDHTWALDEACETAEEDAAPVTICAQCQHYLSSGPVWYDQFCRASPLAKAIDPVTGEVGYRVSGGVVPMALLPQPYEKCRTVNNGHCPLYKAKS